MNPKYYEAVIQIRESPKEVYDTVIKEIENNTKGVFLSKTEKTTNGTDYYISSNRFALELGRKLKKRFKGELKTSRRLFGKDGQTSKTLYRATVMYRHNSREKPLPFKR